MKVVISGSRSILNKELVESYLNEFNPKIEFLICGYDPKKRLPKGVDEIAYRWAINKGIPVDTFPANWEKYGKMAGRLRNKQMVDCGDVLIAIWDGQSTGTLSTITYWKEKMAAIFNNPDHNCFIFQVDNK